MSSPEDPKKPGGDPPPGDGEGEEGGRPSLPHFIMGIPMGGGPQQSPGVHPQIAMMMTQSAEKTRMLEQAVILIGIFRQTNHPGFGHGTPVSNNPPVLSTQETTAYNAALMCVARVFNMGDVSPEAVTFMSGPTA